MNVSATCETMQVHAVQRNPTMTAWAYGKREAEMLDACGQDI